jgi:NDP-sugar pyrophosphorylase family protein
MFSRLEENFLVMYGGTMLEVDLARFESFHNSRLDVDATLFCTQTTIHKIQTWLILTIRGKFVLFIHIRTMLVVTILI